jgi:hypothetical protein
MRWATRAGVHIDRAACAWLIRRHIDPDARFLFVARRPSRGLTGTGVVDDSALRPAGVMRSSQ